jgi:LacI family transcriptional regulator
MAGQFLPSERQLVSTHGWSGKTVRRALKILESEALIVAESRRGYRVVARALDPDKGCPLAFVVSNPRGIGTEYFYRRIQGELQVAAGRRGWSLLGVGAEGKTPGEIAEQLQTARACGVIVDSVNPVLLELFGRIGIPVVMVDAWLAGAAFDAVIQDSFAGGLLAVSHLIERGHRRIGFLGHALAGADLQVIERYCGVVGGMLRAGLVLPGEMIAEGPFGNPAGMLQAARELLSRPNRPEAVLALWQGATVAVARAARELGLVVGRDFEMVGWSTTEDYESEFLPNFPEGNVPAAVVWSVADLAETCIGVLMQRRAGPRMPTALTRIPMRVKTTNDQQ